MLFCHTLFNIWCKQINELLDFTLHWTRLKTKVFCRILKHIKLCSYLSFKPESRQHFPFCVPGGSLCNLLHKGVQLMVHNFPNLIFSHLITQPTNMTLQTFFQWKKRKSNLVYVHYENCQRSNVDVKYKYCGSRMTILHCSNNNKVTYHVWFDCSAFFYLIFILIPHIKEIQQYNVWPSFTQKMCRTFCLW